MKLFGLAVLVLAVFAMLMGGVSAHPAPGSALKNGAKAIKTGVGVIGAIGTGKEIYDKVKNRG